MHQLVVHPSHLYYPCCVHDSYSYTGARAVQARTIDWLRTCTYDYLHRMGNDGAAIAYVYYGLRHSEHPLKIVNI